MEYEVLPEFLNQSEQRIGGMLTPFQMIAGMCGLLPLIVAAQVSFWWALGLVPLIGLAIWGMAPAEGTFQFNLWLLPLLASIPGLPPPIRNWKPFKSVSKKFSTTAPLYFAQDDELVLVADLAQADDF